MEKTINLNGRKLINSNITQYADSIITTCIYDDETILRFTQKNDSVKVDCNKGLQVNPNGTIDII